MAGGRPPVYDPDYHVERCRELAELGYIDTAIAKGLGVSYSAFRLWKTEGSAEFHPEFLAALETGRKAMLANVEPSAYRLAMGHVLEDETVEVFLPNKKQLDDLRKEAAARDLDFADYVDENGFMHLAKVTRREVSPNFTAVAFVLCNRRPKGYNPDDPTDGWQHVNRVDVTGSLNVAVPILDDVAEPADAENGD